MKVAAVVVTYNRKELLRECLQVLLNQTRPLDEIIVVDNASTDGTDQVVSREFPQITYVRLSENIGGAGGFHEGMKRAYEKGHDWIWGMDDDAIPARDALAKLMTATKAYPDQPCFWSNCNNDRVFDSSIKKVTSWMFVGFFIHRNLIEKIGFPRADFFLYHDDSEYAQRIRAEGYWIYKVRDSIIQHGDFSSRSFYERRILGKKRRVPKMPDWKLYYYVRNSLLMYPHCSLRKCRAIAKAIKLCMFFAIVDRTKCKVVVKGLFHGIIGKSGKG